MSGHRANALDGPSLALRCSVHQFGITPVPGTVPVHRDGREKRRSRREVEAEAEAAAEEEERGREGADRLSVSTSE